MASLAEARPFARADIEDFQQLYRRRMGRRPRTASGSTISIRPTSTTSSADFPPRPRRMRKPRYARRPCAFAAWRKTSISARAKILNTAADYLEANAERVRRRDDARARQAGQSRKDEFLRSAQTLRFYAVEGQSFAGEVFPHDDADMIVYTEREPLGVVSVITPWNFPVSIPARKIAPALITGNTVVFKPSSDAPLSGYRLTEAFVAAGLPKGVLNFVSGRAGDVGAAITAPPVVRAISFTGSTAAGEQIHRSVGFTTRTQMELGGKNPLIVMEDADLDKAVDLAVKGGLSLTGQACTGTSRVLVMQRGQGGVHRKAAGQGEGAQDRQRHDRGQRDWPAGHRAAARDRAALCRDRQARGDAALRRRASHRPWLRPRLLCFAGRCSPTSRRTCALRARRSSDRCSRIIEVDELCGRDRQGQ